MSHFNERSDVCPALKLILQRTCSRDTCRPSSGLNASPSMQKQVRVGGASGNLLLLLMESMRCGCSCCFSVAQSVLLFGHPFDGSRCSTSTGTSSSSSSRSSSSNRSSSNRSSSSSSRSSSSSSRRRRRRRNATTAATTTALAVVQQMGNLKAAAASLAVEIHINAAALFCLAIAKLCRTTPSN